MKSAPTKKTPSQHVAWVLKTFFVLSVFGSLAGSVAAGGFFWLFSMDVPELISPEQYKPLGVTQILGHRDPSGSDQKQDVLAEFYKERRYILKPNEIPELVVRAFISAEDDRFFEHQGFNVAAILRAAIANFKAGHVVQGGSTITQQVAKSLLLTNERSFTRKFKELILASRMERDLDKHAILFLYLNQIYLGNGAYGVEAAARAYFRKPAKELTLAEAAILAGLPQAPGKYSPLLNPRYAKKRQLYVLRRMYENNYITQNELNEAGETALRVYHADETSKEEVGYFVEHVRRQLLSKYGEKALYEEGLTVQTAASRELLKVSYESLRSGLRQIDKRLGFRGPIRRLKTEQERESFLADKRKALIRQSLEFEALSAEGELSIQKTLELAGIQNEIELLKSGQLYEGLVMSLDDAKKTVSVWVGAAQGELPIELMKWARTHVDSQGAVGSEPSVPSKVLKKGDVVWVRLATPEERAKRGGALPVFALEQKPEVQGALVSLDVDSGRVLAMQGGYDFKESEFNRAVQATRQVGSSFKPFIYSAAIESGFTPASLILDAPIVYSDGDEGKWKPANYEEKFYGDTTLRLSLIKSRNVPTIKLVQAVGINNLLSYAKRFGFGSEMSPDLSIALGSTGGSLFDLTRAYSVFPRLGRSVDPIDIVSVVDRSGVVLEQTQEQRALTAAQWKSLLESKQLPGPVVEDASASDEAGEKDQPRFSEHHGESEKKNALLLKQLGVERYPTPQHPNQVLDPRVAYVMTHLMGEVITSGTGSEARNLGRPAAGKTGTTNDYADAWFMAYTPQVVTGVWVGYDAQKPLGPGETGGRAALPIWLSFMKEAMKSYPHSEFEVPQGVSFALIHGETGKFMTQAGPGAVNEAFVEGTQPSSSASTEGGSAVGPAESADFFKEDMQ